MANVFIIHGANWLWSNALLEPGQSKGLSPHLATHFCRGDTLFETCSLLHIFPGECQSAPGLQQHSSSLPLAQLSPRRAILQPEFGWGGARGKKTKSYFPWDLLRKAANSQVPNLFPLFALGLSVSISGCGSASISTSSSTSLTMVSSLRVSLGLYLLPESSGTKSRSESEQRNN